MSKYFELDQAISIEIAKELRADGISQYPVTCPKCQGQGFVTTGADEGLHTCPTCNGEGEINYMVQEVENE